MKTNFEDFPMLIPYKTIQELCELAHEMHSLRQEIDKLKSQLLALRIIQQECIEKIREIDRYL